MPLPEPQYPCPRCKQLRPASEFERVGFGSYCVPGGCAGQRKEEIRKIWNSPETIVREEDKHPQVGVALDPFGTCSQSSVSGVPSKFLSSATFADQAMANDFDAGWKMAKEQRAGNPVDVDFIASLPPERIRIWKMGYDAYNHLQGATL
jgi:hypothetical protein